MREVKDLVILMVGIGLIFAGVWAGKHFSKPDEPKAKTASTPPAHYDTIDLPPGKKLESCGLAYDGGFSKPHIWYVVRPIREGSEFPETHELAEFEWSNNLQVYIETSSITRLIEHVKEEGDQTVTLK